MKKNIKMLMICTAVVMLMTSLAGCVSAGGAEGDDGDKMKEALKGDLTAIVEEIYEKAEVDLNVQTTPVDLTNGDAVRYDMGLTDASKIKEAVVSQALISSQAYSLVLARVENAADAEAVARDMLEGIDPRKWICVEADDVQIVAYDDAILLVMASSTMKDTVTSMLLVDAFEEICGTDLDLTLSK